jgi:hypothetical protein
MAFERKEWLDRQRESADTKIKERSGQLQAAKRSALSAAQVTGDEHWDHFLSIVNERLESKRNEVSLALDLLKNSDNFSPEDLINQKLAVRLIGREVDALQWVSELPQALLEQGDRAKKVLESIDETAG